MNKKLAIGVDLGGTAIKAGLCDQDGTILKKIQVPTGELTPDAVCARIAKLVSDLAESQSMAVSELSGVGLAIPGGIYPDKATVSQSPNFPEWKDLNIKEMLEQQGIPNPVLDNDANLAALGENWIGCGKDFEHMVLFTLGTGVGGGLIFHNKVFSGAFGMAGELGHMTIYPNGRKCGCGNSGCLEQYASGPAMVDHATFLAHQEVTPVLSELIDNDPEKITPKLIAEAARKGDQGCQQVMSVVGQALGIAFASLLNCLNLPLFAIGGGVSPAFDLFEETLLKEVRQRAFKIPAQKVVIRQAKLGNDAGLIGAARLAFKAESEGCNVIPMRQIGQ